MQKNGKVLIVAVVLFVVSAGSLFAAPVFVTSPQRQATAGQFWDDADNFIDPRGWADMEFDNWFGMVSFGSTQMARLGFASNFGGLYIALFYGGNAWNTMHSFNRENVTFFGTPTTMRVYSSMPRFSAGDSLPNNNISLLVGVADMGFRLSYRGANWSRNINEDFESRDPFSPGFFRNFREDRGSINTEFAWGMTRELLPGRGLRPHAYINVDFHRNYERFERYQTATSIVDQVTRSENSIDLGFTAIMGEFSIIRQDGFDFGVDLSYEFILSMFNNDFNYMVGVEQRVGSGFSGTFSSTPFLADDFEEINRHRHYLTPSFYAVWSGERMAVSAEFGLGMSFSSERTADMALVPNTDTLRNHGIERIENIFAVNPTLDVGIQWGIIPDRLFLNVGGSIGFGVVEFTNAEVVNYVDGIRDASSEITEVSRSFSEANTRLSAGFTFQMTPNIGVQAKSGIEIDGNIVSLFRQDGFASFSEILVTLNF